MVELLSNANQHQLVDGGRMVDTKDNVVEEGKDWMRSVEVNGTVLRRYNLHFRSFTNFVPASLFQGADPIL
jgi:hypothetical protein